MKKYTIHTNACRILSDMLTPVALYLKIRDLYPESALLESTEYRTPESSYSYIGFCPIASYKVQNGAISMQYPDGLESIEPLKANQPQQISAQFASFCHHFEIAEGKPMRNLYEVSESNPTEMNGLFGFTSYDVVSHLEPVQFHPSPSTYEGIPQMHYIYYRYVVVMNMYRNEMYILENLLEHESSHLHQIMAEVENKNFDVFGFSKMGEKSSNMTDEQYREMVRDGIRHCQRGDVFQIVLSRRFRQSFLGDDFQVYRTLRSVNPSPYLFYFDFGSYRIFGSSPETHFRIQGEEAYIDPIAGTFKRTGDEAKDREAAQELLKDPKENAEHVMLVDLARNDLSRHATDVTVKKYKELQFYSHVIHIVSRVVGKLSGKLNPMELFLDTFPAGTLSGAPKVRALQLIGELEPHSRGFYGGCIGYIGFNGDLNQAITIRSFLSKNNSLYFQAGAGVVAKSDPESELQEVNNKLGALCRAIEMAEVTSKADQLTFTR